MIVHFTKCKQDSTVKSVHIARFIQEQTGLPIFDEPDAHPIESNDVLIIVNGPFAFCSFLEQIGELVLKAKKVIWVQNDYTIRVPISNGKAETPFRKAFVTRNLRPIHWTLIPSNIKTAEDRLIPWSYLSYRKPMPVLNSEKEGLYYHGAYRKGRESSFRTYFNTDLYPIHIDTTGPQRARSFLEHHPNVQIVSDQEPNLLNRINKHQLGLLIADDNSYRTKHGLPDRFFEYLGAGIPMAIDHRFISQVCSNQEWSVRSPNDCLNLLTKDKEELVRDQHQVLDRPYDEMLMEQFQIVWKEYL